MSYSVPVKIKHSEKSRDKVNVIQRTTSETLRLTDSEFIGSNSITRQVMANQPARKKTSSSFQVTGVSLTQRDGGGDDSADDLDESHTDDISRVTDNETPSCSEDTCSRDADDVHGTFIISSAYSGSVNSVGVLPVQPGLCAVPSGNITIATATTTDTATATVQDLTVPTDSSDLPVTTSTRIVGERFKVVKIESTVPFYRGRWTCMDYLDHSIHTPKDAYIYCQQQYVKQSTLKSTYTQAPVTTTVLATISQGHSYSGKSNNPVKVTAHYVPAQTFPGQSQNTNTAQPQQQQEDLNQVVTDNKDICHGQSVIKPSTVQHNILPTISSVTKQNFIVPDNFSSASSNYTQQYQNYTHLSYSRQNSTQYSTYIQTNNQSNTQQVQIPNSFGVMEVNYLSSTGQHNISRQQILPSSLYGIYNTDIQQNTNRMQQRYPTHICYQYGASVPSSPATVRPPPGFPAQPCAPPPQQQQIPYSVNNQHVYLMPMQEKLCTQVATSGTTLHMQTVPRSVYSQISTSSSSTSEPAFQMNQNDYDVSMQYVSIGNQLVKPVYSTQHSYPLGTVNSSQSVKFGRAISETCNPQNLHTSQQSTQNCPSTLPTVLTNISAFNKDLQKSSDNFQISTVTPQAITKQSFVVASSTGSQNLSTSKEFTTTTASSVIYQEFVNLGNVTRPLTTTVSACITMPAVGVVVTQSSTYNLPSDVHSFNESLEKCNKNFNNEFIEDSVTGKKIVTSDNNFVITSQNNKIQPSGKSVQEKNFNVSTGINLTNKLEGTAEFIVSSALLTNVTRYQTDTESTTADTTEAVTCVSTSIINVSSSDSITSATTSNTTSSNQTVRATSITEDIESVSGASTVAIDNKIEQAMDLVKSHLMYAVREEVEVLKERISELLDRINQLEVENSFLRANASAEVLSALNNGTTESQQGQGPNNTTASNISGASNN